MPPPPPPPDPPRSSAASSGPPVKALPTASPTTLPLALPSGMPQPLPSAMPQAMPSASSQSPPPTTPDVHYTVFIRLPFARGEFVDPPSVEWNAAKDRALWKILSSTPKSNTLDWNEISTRFGVPLSFVLQQAAWLYERQLSQVRAQMRKVDGTGGASNPHVSSHAPGMPGSLGGQSLGSATVGVNVGGAGSPAAGGVQMRRLGSADSRGAPSSATGKSRDSSVPAGEKSGSGSGTPRTMGLQRLQTTSNSKVAGTQRETLQSPRQPSNLNFQRSADSSVKSKAQTERMTRSPGSGPRLGSGPGPALASSGVQPRSPQSNISRSALQPLSSEDGDGDSLSPSSSSSSDSSANYDSATHPIRRSQLFRQPLRFSSKKPSYGRNRENSLNGDDENYNDYLDYQDNADGDNEDDENPAFLPFAQGQSGLSKTQQSEQQNSASATPTATTVRSGQDGAGGSFGREGKRGRVREIDGGRDDQQQQQQQRRIERSVLSSDGSSLSSSAAAASSSKLSGPEEGSANTTNITARNAGPVFVGSRLSVPQSAPQPTPAPTQTATSYSTRPSRHREAPSAQPTQPPAAKATTASTSKPTAAGPPSSMHPPMNSSSSSSSNNDNNMNPKFQSQNRSQPPSDNNSQSRNNSQSQAHRADLAQLSPRQRASLRRDRHGGSDGGTPSMGSSFSDLDDTSVTQSALEEALLSNMQHQQRGGGSSIGGRAAIASRMSSLSQALRSKYL